LIRAKKSLGQHFLQAIDYARRIAAAVDDANKNVVEVGPGQGVLTQFLTGRFEKLLLIEKDTELARLLTLQYQEDPHIVVCEGDFLSFDLSAYWGDQQFAIVGNFPYNISSQIVFRMLDFRAQVPELVGMFQYEMARRILAGPGSKEYGIISVLTSVAYEGKLIFRVPPGAFHPPPKVESAVIHLKRKANYSIPCEHQTLRQIVRMAFNQRRKMLRNSLKPLFSENILKHDLFSKRPEQLSLHEFIDLAIQYEQQVRI
jgi:16S rRNA (adenine1518-N6/adenine1519-N6)-dimethyltransferase